jgi:CheY-like chemotaxis protein
MKTKVLIIEDNFYKYFTTKQVLESQLKLDVRTQDVGTSRELVAMAQTLNPDVVMFRPDGGVAELLTKMKKRRTNRRNTEITLLLAQDFDDEAVRKFQDYFESMAKGVAHAA